MTIARVALAVDATLGEGLHWDARRNCLWMVDIHGKRLIHWSGVGSSWDEWAMPERIGWAIPCSGSEALLAGLQSGFARLHPGASGWQVEWINRVFQDRPGLRLNDAKADASGAVWAGSLNNDDESRSDGQLFRLAPDGGLETHDQGYLVANGPAIHPDGQLMLHTDSGRRTIYALDLDAPLGTMARKRVWKIFSEADGYPDGMTFDAEGCLWVAHWGGACVSRFSASGALLRRLYLPATNVTNVAFGGTGLDRLFVSTATAGLTLAQRAAEPLAGSLFEVDAGGALGLAGRCFGG